MLRLLRPASEYSSRPVYELRRKGCVVEPPSRVAIGLPGEMTLADPRETTANQSGVSLLLLLSV
jgi:hypothetical protein